ETRMGVTAIGRNEIVALAECAAQEAAAKRRIGNEADAELLQRWQNLGLDVARPQRIFGLDRADRMSLVGATDGVGAGLAQAELADLAPLDKPRHGADSVLDRHVRIDPVDIIEIDHLDAEPLEAGLAGDRHIVRLAVDAAALPAGPADVAELAGNE